ncbi:site-specific integrase [Virgibacillus byunsanensis]|uniref:Site-specific integrase n=1 Tax=Virgibacillus byunsanensis TaxID=570945 RepID=A0ABW3LJ04_9BACI
MDVMKPKASSHVPSGEEWMFEVKYDGFRGVLTWSIETIQLTSKNNKDLTSNFPEIIDFCKDQQAVVEPYLPLTLDGEIVILNNPYQANFSLLQKRGRLKNEDSIRKTASMRPASFCVLYSHRWVKTYVFDAKYYKTLDLPRLKRDILFNLFLLLWVKMEIVDVCEYEDVNILEKTLTHFRFVVRETEIEELKGNQLVKRRVVNIGIMDKRDGYIAPHPLTDFIRAKYEFKGIGISSQINAAREIVKFLNFIYEEIENGDNQFVPLKTSGLKGLRLHHASRYITYLTSKGLKRNTVMTTESYLTRFYHFLLQQELVEEDIMLEQQVNRMGSLVLLSPFTHPSLETRYPSRQEPIVNKLKDFGNNRYQLVVEFIQETREVSPEIALGICFQFYGGLRRGEVVNLTPGCLKPQGLYGMNSLVMDVENHQDMLFSHLKDTKKEQVKKTRKQTVLPNNLLTEVYKKHMEMLHSKKLKNQSVLFFNSNGLAMSGYSYEQKFKKVKESFLSKLLATPGRYSDYKLLSETSWSTHIGRGIFTNFLLDMGLTVTQIAIARGDSNIDSALAYVDKKNTIKNIQEMINEFNNINPGDFGKINPQSINTHWNKDVFTLGKRSRYSLTN